MNSNLSASLAIYQENYSAMDKLIKRMVFAAEKYASYEDCTDEIIDRKNEEIQQIAAFVNIADFVINEVLEAYTPPEIVAEKEDKLAGSILKIIKAGGCESVFEQYKVLKAIL